MCDLFAKFFNYYGTDISRGVTIGGKEIRQASTRPSASTTLIKYERRNGRLKKKPTSNGETSENFLSLENEPHEMKVGVEADLQSHIYLCGSTSLIDWTSPK